MRYLAYLCFVISAGILIYNMVCLWENTSIGGSMKPGIAYHQTNVLAAMVAGLGLLAHPAVMWYWCFAPLLGAILFGMPALLVMHFIYRWIHK